MLQTETFREHVCKRVNCETAPAYPPTSSSKAIRVALRAIEAQVTAQPALL